MSGRGSGRGIAGAAPAAAVAARALRRPWPAARSDWAAIGEAAAKVVLPRSLVRPLLVPLNNSVDEKSGGVPNVGGDGDDSAETGKCVCATVIRK